MTPLILFIIQIITFDGKPVSRAHLTCENLVICEDDGCVPGDTQADSAGRVVIEGPATTYVCTAYSRDWSHESTYILKVDRDHRKFTMRLEP